MLKHCFFLRLVRLDPRLISSALVLYADLLLTVSLCIIGVGLIVSGLSLTELSRFLRSRVQFQVISTKQIPFMQRSILINVNSNYEGISSDSGNEIRSRSLPNRATLVAHGKDMDLVFYLLQRDGVSEIRRITPTMQQIFDKSGDVIGFQDLEIDTGYQAHRSTIDAISIKQICSEFHNSSKLGDEQYISLEKMTFSKNSYKRCMSGLPFSIWATAQINHNNISIANVVKRSFSTVTNVIASDLLGYFNTLLIVRPTSFFEQQSDVWNHKHYISEMQRIPGTVERDSTFFSSYINNRGIKNTFSSASYPVGPIISAVLFSSLFSLILLISASVSVIAAKALLALNIVASYAKLEEYPFSILITSVGVIIALSTIIRYIVISVI